MSARDKIGAEVSEEVAHDLFGEVIAVDFHQSQLPPAENKFHVGNGADGLHYWLTPPDVYADLSVRYGPFDFDPCPFPKPNPCEFRGDRYADLLCHEASHVNGWPANHPTENDR